MNPANHQQYEEELDVPEDAITFVDPVIKAKLPLNAKVQSIYRWGRSLCARTAIIECESGEDYFLKVSAGERGKAIVTGEFESTLALHRASPEFVPKPIAYGSYSTRPGLHFYLCTFHDMAQNSVPAMNAFTPVLANLHKNSRSPNGKFGFHVTTHWRNIPIQQSWTDTWEEYFKANIEYLLAMEEETKGPSDEVRKLKQPFLTKVIPRLLRPMESHGRSLEPCLLHGDLWYGNASVDEANGRPIIFDAASYYGHNECDLGVWRQSWNMLNKEYIVQYHKHNRPSDPAEDQDARNELYSARTLILISILYKNNLNYRTVMIDAMRDLVEKFPDGFDELL